jgi:acetyl esterase/lipase
MQAKRFIFFCLIIACLPLLFTIGCVNTDTSRTSAVTSQSTVEETAATTSVPITTQSSQSTTPATTVPTTLISRPPDPAKLGTIEKDITYATIDGVAIKMDIYYPKSASTALPVVVYVHGGGWTSGDKSSGAGSRTIPELISRGYIVVCINYRLAPEYKIQSQIEDVKCAIRYLRAKAADYGIDKERIGAMGGSAGGHLVALLGTSDESAGLEGNGGYNDRSSRVQAVVDLFGPADMVTMFQNSNASQLQTLFGTSSPYSDVVRKVSPVTYVSSDDPPFLILHGDKDTVVPLNQSEILYQKLTEAKVPATLVVVKNAGHSFTPAGGAISPSQDEINRMIADFFDRYLIRPLK